MGGGPRKWASPVCRWFPLLVYICETGALLTLKCLLLLLQTKTNILQTHRGRGVRPRRSNIPAAQNSKDLVVKVETPFLCWRTYTWSVSSQYLIKNSDTNLSCFVLGFFWSRLVLKKKIMSYKDRQILWNGDSVTCLHQSSLTGAKVKGSQWDKIKVCKKRSLLSSFLNFLKLVYLKKIPMSFLHVKMPQTNSSEGIFDHFKKCCPALGVSCFYCRQTQRKVISCNKYISFYRTTMHINSDEAHRATKRLKKVMAEEKMRVTELKF